MSQIVGAFSLSFGCDLAAVWKCNDYPAFGAYLHACFCAHGHVTHINLSAMLEVKEAYNMGPRA